MSNLLPALAARLGASATGPSLALSTHCRSISTSAPLAGKKNFRKFLLYNKRGPRIFKQQRRTDPDPEMPVDRRGVRDTGYTTHDGHYVEVPEKIPQLVVPSLAGFQLKPYVSYKAADVVQSEFTAQDLFDAVYSRKIVEDFKAGKLDANGAPLEPSAEERLDAEEAWSRARRTGSDIF